MPYIINVIRVIIITSSLVLLSACATSTTPENNPVLTPAEPPPGLQEIPFTPTEVPDDAIGAASPASLESPASPESPDSLDSVVSTAPSQAVPSEPTFLPGLDTQKGGVATQGDTFESTVKQRRKRVDLGLDQERENEPVNNVLDWQF